MNNEESLIRFFRVDIFLIKEIWSDNKVLENEDLLNPNAKNGKFVVEIGIEQGKSLHFLQNISRGEGYSLQSARVNMLDKYKKSTHGFNALKRYFTSIGQYINNEIKNVCF